MRFVIFDLEATCWNGHAVGREQEIIEIGAILTDPFGNRISDYQKFVRPVENPTLSHFCRDLTGIEQGDVDSAATYDRVIRSFMDWVEVDSSDYTLCSWGDKDLELLQDDCSRHDIETDWLDHYIDLKGQYHQIKGLQRKRGLKRTLSHENIEFEGSHHRALDDAQNLYTLFVKYKDSWMY